MTGVFLRGHLPALMTVVASGLLQLAVVRQVYTAVVELFGLAPLPRLERWMAFVGAAALVSIWALGACGVAPDLVRALRPAGALGWALAAAPVVASDFRIVREQSPMHVEPNAPPRCVNLVPTRPTTSMARGQ
jgi:hypothetical protein